jgi:hypothetical protein
LNPRELKQHSLVAGVEWTVCFSGRKDDEE